MSSDVRVINFGDMPDNRQYVFKSISDVVYQNRMRLLQRMRCVACPQCGRKRYYDCSSQLAAGLTVGAGGCPDHGGCGIWYSFALQESQ